MTGTRGPAVADDEGRRRVIDLAMSRRPEMTVGELHAVLRRLGIRVTSETVVADLDVLGYRVEDGDRVALAVDVDDAGTDATDDEGPRAGGGRGGWGARVVPVLVVVAVVLALVAAALAVVALLDDDDEGPTGARSGAAPVPVAPSPSAGGDGGPGASTATDPAPGPPDVEVAFEGEGALPPPGQQGPWVAARGGWFLAGGAARVDAPGEDEAVTYFAAPTPDVAAEVTLPEASAGAGVAFRLVDDTDYLAWTLSGDGQGVQLVRVEGAVQTVLLGPELDVAVAPGVVLGVRATGADIALTVDGEEVATTTDPGPVDRVGVGLVVLGTDEVPAFDDLRVTFL